MPRTSLALLIALSIATFGCTTDECDDGADCSICIGRVAADDGFPFVQEWNGTAELNGTEVPVQIMLESLEQPLKPERARGTGNQSFCEDLRYLSVRWTVEVGDSYSNVQDEDVWWNRSERLRLTDQAPLSDSNRALAPADDAWPAQCPESSNLNTRLEVDADPDYLALSMGWSDASECYAQALELELGDQG